MAMGFNPNTITSANTVISIRAKGIIDDWVKLEGAQTDAFMSLADVTFGVSEVGVDGFLYIGWIPHTTSATLSLAPNSRSIDVLELIYNTFLKNRDVSQVELQAYYPSVKRRQVIKGTLTVKSGGTGVASVLNGHTYTLVGLSDGIEKVN